MAVIKILIELGSFDVVVICAVLAFILCKAINRPKKQSKPSDISFERRLKDKEYVPQVREDEKRDEQVLRSEEETKNIELHTKGQTPVNERKQNTETKGPQSASTDHSKVDDSNLALQKSPSENDVSDDLTPFTEANNTVSNAANLTELAGCMGGQERLKQFRDECFEVALFFDRCNQRLIEIGTNDQNVNKSVLKKAIFDFLSEIDHQKQKAFKHEMPSQTVKRTLNNFRNLYLNVTKPDYDANMSSAQVGIIRANLTCLGWACNSLANGFIRFGNESEDSFAEGSDDRWKGLKKKVEADFKSASKWLEGIDKTNLLKIEEIVEGLNDEVQQFLGKLLKVEDL